MPAKPSIRWTKTLENDLRREIKNYNRRLTTAEKVANDKVKPILPSRIYYSKLKKGIQTKAQYNELMRLIRLARKENFKPVKPGKPSVFESAYKKSRYEISAGTFVPRGTIPSAVPKQEEESADRKKLRKLVNELDTEKKIGRFLTSRDLVIKGIKGDTEGVTLEKVEAWVQSTSSQAERWRTNYLNTIEWHMQQALLSEDQASYDKLAELYKTISQMDLTRFVIAQLHAPTRLSIGQGITSPKQRVRNKLEADIMSSQYDSLIQSWEYYA